MTATTTPPAATDLRTGDRAALEGLLHVLDTFTMMFPIVTP